MLRSALLFGDVCLNCNSLVSHQLHFPLVPATFEGTCERRCWGMAKTAESSKKRQLGNKKWWSLKIIGKTKTYNSGYSLVVTHLTTNPPVRCLNRAERTGSLVFNVMVVCEELE